MNLLTILIFIALVGLAGLLIWWLIFESEGVYLGRRVVVLLYDLYAKRYDRIKRYDPIHEHRLLAQPLLAQIAPQKDPFVLDVGTGTGRLALALAQHARFEGHIIGLDLSLPMLREASEKIREEHFEEFITLIQSDASALPFDEDSFDVVTCLEALEFMPSPANVLSELCRVLRPGGTLLITNRIHTSWMPGKIWSVGDLTRLLEQNDILYIEFERWQYDYDKVWGQKSGESDEVGPRPLQSILRCHHCGKIHPDIRCPHCGQSWKKDENGIFRPA